MRSSIIALILVLLYLPSLHSQEIEVVKPVLIAKAPQRVKEYNKVIKAWAEVDGHEYAFNVFLKNVSDKNLTVVTGGLSRRSSSSEAKQEVTLDMMKMNLADDGGLIVPPRENFQLVELRPGEVALTQIVFKMSVPLEELTVTYNPKDFYDGRFGYWVGKVSSKAAKIE